jgi:hypothetical protein
MTADVIVVVMTNTTMTNNAETDSTETNSTETNSTETNSTESTSTTASAAAITSDRGADLTARIDAHLAAYCDPDPDRRAGPLADAWTADGRLVDPPMEATGPGAISGLADVVAQHYPGHVFRRTSMVDHHHEFARYSWALVAPDGSDAVTGLDVVRVAPDGRIAGIVGFFGDLTPV